MINVLGKNVYIDTNTFTNNQNIVSVDLCNIPFVNNTMYNAFFNCKNIINVTNVNQNVTNMAYAFYHCDNIIQSPTIPNSVDNMQAAFGFCGELTNIPTIPNSVSSMYYTFFRCDNLTNVNLNVQNCNNLSNTFNNCINLKDVNINAPKCTNITDIFKYCTNLTNVYLELNNISNFSNLFNDYKNLSNVVLLSQNSANLSDTFRNCSSLTTVIIPDSVTNIERTFFNCTSLINAPTIPNNAISMLGTFSDCNNLINVPSIPNSVTEMIYTFKNCSNLVNAPILPSNVIDLGGAFMNCTNLNVAPDIPNGVTNMCGTFLGCVNLINAPVIPSSVTKIGAIAFEPYGAFENCTSLSGNIYIQSENITNAGSCFYGTSLQKNVYIPFTYENGVNTLTYNSFILAGYDTLGTNCGVYLKDIDGSKITINPTPNDSTVLMFNEEKGAEIDLSKFTYTNTNNNIEIQTLNTNDVDIVVPSIYTQTTYMRGIDGDVIDYIVSKEGYETVRNSVTVSGSETINVNLEQIMCTFTVNPIPADATVALEANNLTPGTVYYAWWQNYDDYTSRRLFTTTLTPQAGDPIWYFGYDAERTEYDISKATQMTILASDNGGVWTPFMNNGELYMRPGNMQLPAQKCNRYEKFDIIPPGVQFGNSITVPWGTEVSYTVSKSHYQTVTGTSIVKTTGAIGVSLQLENHRFTINPPSSAAIVQILVNGKLANASNSDWKFTSNNTNGDIELQDYIGTNTDVTMPTEYIISTNSVLAEYGSTIEYKVSYNGKEETDTLTLTEDTTVDVEFLADYDVSDYTYTLNNDTLILETYTGTGGDISVPEGQ